jgi:YhcH/YjgK/YiaL family protein
MYGGTLKDLEQYDYQSERFRRAYAWLKAQDLAHLPLGDYEIGGPDVVAHVQEYMTTPLSECVMESHRHHFDIQYVISGTERFGVCRLDGLQVSEDHPDRDIIFYPLPAQYGTLVLGPGEFVIVSPSDAHAPHIMIDAPAKMRKAVIKIEAD